MTMHMNRDPKWLLEKARQEGGCHVSVGGLAKRPNEPVVLPEPAATSRRLAFARFVELSRRSLGLSVEDFARKADVDVDSVLAIEEACETPEPRTVYRIADVLRVSQRRLLVLSGLAESVDERFHDATVRFAARSERMDALSKVERHALDEFVRVLAERTDSD